jgi:hypothetical protein
MANKYVVRLSSEERVELEQLVSKGKAAAYRIRHANVLLAADVNGPAWVDEKIAEGLHVHINMVHGVRKRFVEQGLEAAVERKKQQRPSRACTFDGEAEAKLIAVACASPPKGRARWSLRLLADKMVELKVVDTVSHETVRQTLKKTNSSLICVSAIASHRSRMRRS